MVDTDALYFHCRVGGAESGGVVGSVRGGVVDKEGQSSTSSVRTVFANESESGKNRVGRGRGEFGLLEASYLDIVIGQEGD